MKRIMMIALALCLVAGTAQALTMTGLETETLGRSWEDSAFFPRMEALTGIAVEAHGESESAKYQELLSGMQQGEITVDALAPIQARYREIRDSQELLDALKDGGQRANAIAEKTMKRVKDRFGLGL